VCESSDIVMVKSILKGINMKISIQALRIFREELIYKKQNVLEYIIFANTFDAIIIKKGKSIADASFLYSTCSLPVKFYPSPLLTISVCKSS